MQLITVVNIKSRIFALFLVGITFPIPLLAAPGQDQLQQMFQSAMQNRDSGKTFQAIKLFQTILNDQPNLNRVRLELAVAYNQAAQYEDALRLFKKVLDDPTTPENVKLSILAYLGQVNSDELKPASQHHISYYVNLGTLQNSNINATPGAGLSPITGISTDAKISSFGLHTDLSMSDRYQVKAPLDVGGTAAYFEWLSQVGVSGTHYTKTSKYDYNVVTVSSGPSISAPGRWRSYLNLRVDQILLDSKQLATFASINPTVIFELGHYRDIKLESSYSRHNYDQIGDYGRDGTEAMLGAGYNSLIHNNTIGLEAGFRQHQNRAAIDGFSYDDSELYFSGFTVLSAQAALYIRLNHHHYQYIGIDPTAFIKRNENESIAAVGYNRDLRSGALKHWTFNLELSADKNVSNVQDYEYKRYQISASISRYFQ